MSTVNAVLSWIIAYSCSPNRMPCCLRRAISLIEHRRLATGSGAVVVYGLVAAFCCQVPSVHAGQPAYDATVQRTAGGIPTIIADDYGSLGFGTGYAMAQDNVCLLADLFLTYSAERSRFLGAQDGKLQSTAERSHFLGAQGGNLQSDFFYQLFIDRGEARQPVDARQTALFLGAAAGYNRYLRDVGVDDLPDSSCRGKPWVRPIAAIDFRRISRMNFFYPQLLPQIVATVPPTKNAASAINPRLGNKDLASQTEQALLAPVRELGSNGVAIGSAGTVDRTGMLLANPHMPWHGPYRFYAFHQIIPGKLNVFGANIMGRPVVGVGTTEHVAWTSTVQTAAMHTFYRLDLVKGKPTRYLFDGKPQDMVAETVTVKVPDGNGGFTERSHTFYSTHYGAILIGGRGLPWTGSHAYAVRATDAGWRGVNALIPEFRAKSVRELKAINDKYQFNPSNVIAADSSGEAYYANPAPIPDLTDAQQGDCKVPGGLDGSRSACMWKADPAAAEPGILGPEKLPSIIRRDYVTNSNDSYWLANPAAPLTGFYASIGSVGTQRTLRTRSGLTMVRDRLAGTDGQPGERFTLAQLQGLMMSDKAYTGQLLRDGLVTLCHNHPRVTLDDSTVVDISGACPVLAAWDLHENLDSRGALLFREFGLAAGIDRTLPTSMNYVAPFDSAHPVDTPRGLNPTDNPNALRALAAAVKKLQDGGIALDARLGVMQYVTRNGVRIPIHGGPGAITGEFNYISGYSPSTAGYPITSVVAGSSWIQVTEFTKSGPVSRGLLTYSQSTNPDSPHYSDMTVMFSQKKWVDLPFTAEAVAAAATSTLHLTETASPAAE